MVKKTGTGKSNGKQRDQLDDDLDALFMLPLTEFTAARNALASQLKKSGRSNEAEFVKTLAKPPLSAWAVNQLYWRHRDAFNRLLDSGERFRQAQSSAGARKVADMRAALDVRRESLSELSNLAEELMRDAGHNPTQEFTRRIATTLEAMSAYASQPDGPKPGRLTQDVDPPGFESLASFVPSGTTRPLSKELSRNEVSKRASPPPSQKPSATDKRALRKTEAANDAREREKDRHVAIAAAKGSAQEAKRMLAETRTKTQNLEAAHKKAHSEARDAEKQRSEAEAILKKAKAAAENSAERLRNIGNEVDQARQELEDAKRAVDKTSKELEKLFRSPTK